MRPLKTISTRKLFILYISLSALLLGAVGSFVVHQQSVQVVAKIQEETTQIELQTAKRYLLQYLNDREIAYRRLSALPEVVQAVTQTPIRSSSKLQIKLEQAQIFAKKAQLTIYNRYSQPIMVQMAPDNYPPQQLKVVGRILTGAPGDSLIQLVQKNQHEYFMLYLPIVAHAQIEGVMVVKLDFDLAYFFSTIISNHNRRISLSQPSAGIEMFPIDNNRWRVYEVPLGYSDLVMNYAVSTQAQITQRDNLLYRLGGMLGLSLILSLFLIYLLGQRLLVRPFQELANNREQLARHSRLLIERETMAKRLAQVAQHAHDAIVITDSNGAITWVNSAFSVLTGYHSDEVLGSSPGILLQGPDSDVQTRQRIGDALAKRQGIRTEVLNYKKDGQSYWVDIDITPVFNPQGELESYIAVQRDISEQRHLEESLRQALRHAKEANNSKLRFLARMSHEIRTPMNGVLGLTQLLEQTPLTPLQRSYLDDLYSSGQHMMALLNDILDFSKIDAQRLQLEPTQFSLTEVLQGIRSTYSALSKQKGINFILDNCVKQPHLFADRDRIRQVILNLISNAMKFTHDGYVKIIAKESYYQKQLYLIIRVEDSGIGIANERQAHIFNAFTQAESSTTRLYGGSGLGLAIVRQLCQAMGGDVRVRSKIGQGSRFTATMQVDIGQAESLERAPVAHRLKMANLPLLIAEDNRTNGMIIRAFFEKRGFQSKIVLDGAQAIEAIAAQSYSIILMDNHMPQMSGIAATRHIRRMKAPDCFSLIIGCTADAYSDTRSEMLAAGINDILTKPLQNEAIDTLLIAHQPHFRRWQLWYEQSIHTGLPSWVEAPHWIDETPHQLQIHAQQFLDQQPYLWEQLNAQLNTHNYEGIHERATMLYQHAKALRANELEQGALHLQTLSQKQQLPELIWLGEFQHLMQDVDQKLRCFIAQL
ncbi:hybrid sensor histidine kinase/response regulator [Celerinatantimonas yamalensis]|uniref:histidine kinase n=1 Tax=Celerinatantimonas yamalensis TaxID=559956 RepID=A0ABW9G8K9_9GAMM